VSDVQAGADAVVEIIEALRQGGDLEAICAILNTFLPRAHPVEVSLAILLTARRDPRIWLDCEYDRACDRLESHMRETGRGDVDEVMRVLRMTPP
jgi:hypothetical protein